jgi:hypothetical protein
MPPQLKVGYWGLGRVKKNWGIEVGYWVKTQKSWVCWGWGLGICILYTQKSWGCWSGCGSDRVDLNFSNQKKTKLS